MAEYHWGLWVEYVSILDVDHKVTKKSPQISDPKSAETSEDKANKEARQ